MPSILSSLIWFLLGLTLTGCSYLRHPDIPIKTDIYQKNTSPQHTLILLLPGKGDNPNSFIENQWLETLQQENIDADIIIADAHLGYYLNDSTTLRLRQDILTDLIVKRYSQIWIAGVSMGALGALQFSLDYPCMIDGLILIAPYLGPETLIKQIIGQGGIDGWRPSNSPDPFVKLWSGVKDKSVVRPDMYLGYGQKDRYVLGHHLFAKEVDVLKTIISDGGHDWETWNKLWSLLLEQSPLVQQASAPSHHNTTAACKDRQLLSTI